MSGIESLLLKCFAVAIALVLLAVCLWDWD